MASLALQVLNDASTGSERRQAARTRTVYRVAHLKVGQEEGLGWVRNISDTGVKIEAGLPMCLGDVVRVRLSETLEVEGQVVWSNGREFGLEFDTPINSSAALSYMAQQARTGAARPLRLPVSVPAVVSSEKGLRAARVKDISQRGAKVLNDGSFVPGLAVTLKLPSGLERRGHVRWVDGQFAGLMLNDPFLVTDLENLNALG